MYRTILVPLDGSKLAECVLPHVEALVRDSQSKVIFAAVVEPTLHPPGGYMAFPTEVAMEITSKRRLEAEAYLNKVIAAGLILRSACVPVLMVRAPGCVPGI